MTELDALLSEVRAADYERDMDHLRRRIAGGRKGRVSDARRDLKRRTTDKLREELGR